MNLDPGTIRTLLGNELRLLVAPSRERRVMIRTLEGIEFIERGRIPKSLAD